jgi:hypothetical protein
MENKFNILIKPGKIEFFYKLKQGVIKGYLLISLFTSGVIEDGQDIYIEALCPNKNNLSMGKYYPYFINGVGLLIEDNELISCKGSDDEFIYFKIILYNNLNKLTAFFGSCSIMIKSIIFFKYDNFLFIGGFIIFLLPTNWSLNAFKCSSQHISVYLFLS